MKTKILFTTVLFVLITGGFANADFSNHNLNDAKTIFQPEVNSESESIVKGIVYEGEVIPYVELQEIQIRGNRNPEHLIKAKMIDGEIVSAVELDEIVIKPNS